MTAASKVCASGKDMACKEELPAAPPGLGRRHLQMLLLSLGLALGYTCRINLSICIVAMTSTESASGYPVYDWEEWQRGVTLSSFFWGYVLMQVPGAALANRYGPARFVLLGITGCAALTCMTPLVAAWGGWRLLCALRMAEGLCQGVIFPSVHFMLGRWAAPVERGRFSAMVFSGTSVGTLCAMGGVGMLCGSPLGWPSGFYVPGGLALIWGLVWYRFGADSPAKCRGMSAEERDYIQSALGSSSSSEKRLSVPWGPMLRTPAMWALIAVHMCNNFGHWLMLTHLPNFMKTMLHFNIKENGLVSSLPYLCLFLSSAFVGYMSQVVNEKHCVSVATSRKIFNTLGHYGTGITLLVLSFLTPIGVPVGVAVGLLTVAVSLESAILAGFLVNHVDLSPNFGGAMLAVSNGLGNTMGIVAPILVSMVVGETASRTEQELATGWSRVFLIGSCVYFFGNTIFLVMGRAEVQPWNNPNKDSEKSEKDVPAEAHELLAAGTAVVV